MTVAAAGSSASIKAKVALGSRAMASWSETYGMTDEQMPTPTAQTSQSGWANAGNAAVTPMGVIAMAATIIAAMSLPSVMMAKECVNRAYESGLNDGLLFERRNFHALFATEDQKEGMSAFVEKRKPDFKHR